MYRPCKFRNSQMGIFQCGRHFFENTTQETYDELHSFCKNTVPDKFCSYIDFGFSMQDGVRIYINCTHPKKSHTMKSFNDCKDCDSKDEKLDSIA